MSIERTTSANNTVTCLNSACSVAGEMGEPQASQNRAPSRGSVPHVRHSVAAVIRPPAAQAPASPGFSQHRAPARMTRRFYEVSAARWGPLLRTGGVGGGGREVVCIGGPATEPVHRLMLVVGLDAGAQYPFAWSAGRGHSRHVVFIATGPGGGVGGLLGCRASSARSPRRSDAGRMALGVRAGGREVPEGRPSVSVDHTALICGTPQRAWRSAPAPT